MKSAPQNFYDRAIPPLFFIFMAIWAGLFAVRWWFQVQFFVLHYGEIYFLLWYFIAFVGLYLLSFRKAALKPAALSWAIVNILTPVIFLAAEAVLPWTPRLIPAALVAFNPSLRPEGGPKLAEMIEYLPQSPWVKFKANSWIKSQGNRGSEFSYEWTTDDLGFKNLPEYSHQKMTVLALGDSFVEGMGVPVEKTWATRLCRSGYPTYSLGVQGYAPIQMLGSLLQWGAQFSPRVVIFGYTPSFESRDLKYPEDPRAEMKAGFTGGIESIRTELDGHVYVREIRHVYPVFKITNAALDLIENSWEAFASAPVPRPVMPPSFENAWTEIKQSSAARFDPGAPGFTRTLTDIQAANRKSRRLEARMVVLIFALRPAAYYETLTGKPLPKTHYEMQTRKYLIEFLKKNRIDYIDLLPPMLERMKEWKRRPDLYPLPYFEVDGHPNEAGQEIIAEEVKKRLQKAN